MQRIRIVPGLHDSLGVRNAALAQQGAAFKAIADRLRAEHVVVHELLERLVDALNALAAAPTEARFEDAKTVYHALERVLLFGSLLLVLSAELLNSAIEQVVDKISPEFAVFAGRAKDMGSAAVFVTMLNVIAVWACLLAPRWI